MLPLCNAQGIAVTPWSPLARGLLASSRHQQTVRATTDHPAHHNHQEENTMIEAVKKHCYKTPSQVPPAQIALA